MCAVLQMGNRVNPVGKIERIRNNFHFTTAQRRSVAPVGEFHRFSYRKPAMPPGIAGKEQSQNLCESPETMAADFH